jgi:hypothetical protein
VTISGPAPASSGADHDDDAREMEEERGQTAPQRRVQEHARVDQRLGAAVQPVVLPDEEQHDDDRPAEHEPDRGREPEPLRGPGLGLDHPPGARLENAERDQSEAERRQRGADKVESGALSGRG